MNSSALKDDYFPLIKLAAPLALTGLVQSSLGFFENIFLSRLGENVLAAGALVTFLFFTLVVILFGIFSAVNILISHQYGANDHDSIVHVLRDGLLLVVFLTIPTFILFWKISAVFFLFKQSAELVSLAQLYLHALAWGIFPKFVLVVLYEFLIGLGHSRTIMIITMLSIPFYILFSYVLIFGQFGFPKLGIAGAGWGMTLADWLITSIVCVSLLLIKQYRQYLLSIFTLKSPFFMGEILYLGVPLGTMYCIEVGFFFAVTLVMGTISIPALAANQIAMQYLGPIMGVIFCIAQAITVRMGHQIGAQQIVLAQRTANAGVFLSAFLMSLIAIIYWTLPKLLISVDFDPNEANYAQTIHLAIEFFFIGAFFQILESMRIAFLGALRALKDTHFTLMTSILSYWCIALPLGFLLARYFHLQGAGLWWGMVFGAIFSVLLLHWRFKTRIHRYISHAKSF